MVKIGAVLPKLSEK